MSKAGFTINGDPSVNRGFVATSGQVLTVALEDPTVQSATFDVVATTGGNPTLENSGQLSPVTGDLDITLPVTDFDSFMVRCKVTYQEGPRTVAEVYERLVAVVPGSGLRKILPSETVQYDPLMGWAGSFNTAVVALHEGGGGGGSPESATATPNTLALRTAGSRIAAAGFDGGNLISSSDLELESAGEITMGAATATGLFFGNVGALCQLIGSDIVCSADTVRSQPTLGSTVLTTTVALAYQELFAAGITSVTRGFTQRASGAGAVHRIEGQRGAAGSIGGAVQIASGKGGTSGTNQAGGVRIELGAQATGATDYLHVSEDSSNFLGIRRIGTTAYIESLSSGLTLTSPSDIGFNAVTNGVFRCATAFFDQGTIYWRTAASAIRRIDTIAAGYVQAYDAAVTSLTETLGLASAVRSKTWTDGSAAARVDEYHASVTTTDATVTSCGTVTITNSQVAHITVEVCGYSGATLAASYERKATFRATGGTATLIGSVTSVHTAEDSAGWDCTLDASGATARVRVTGAAATTIRWESKIRVTWSK